MIKKISTLLFFTLFSLSGLSQNQTNNWYFGNGAGLSFSTNPPTPLTTSTMSSNYSSATMSDANGNLLFYANGQNIWDNTHAIMANGSGLLGWNGPQNCIILKQPGNTNLYYVVYMQWNNCFNCTSTIYYSVVDMSLAAGQGSVTTKNATLYTTLTSSAGVGSKVTATRHCNGNDIWILIKESYWNSSINTGTYTPNFRAYLLTSTGINTTAIVSPASTYTVWNNGNYDYWGNIKFSPNGKKLGVANYNNNNINNINLNQSFELYDFDNTTGVVSNSLSLPVSTVVLNNNWNGGGMACEFSPDGTKFYGARYYYISPSYTTELLQWNLCAGSPTAIAASIYTVSLASGYWATSLQLARNGKIYYPVYNTTNLDVINNPNALGAACGFTALGQTTTPKTSWYGLPNFMCSYFVQHPTPTPYTYTVSNSYGCQSALFNSSYNPSITTVGCSSSGYSLTGLQWNFGDPASGSANTSTLVSPVHAFTNLGTYSVNLILYYSCGGGTDTIKQVVNINQPCISVTSTSITCANLGSATVVATGGVGPFSYTWMPSAQANSVATGLSPGTYTLTVFDFGNNYTYTATTLFTSLIPLTGTLNYAGSVTCNGANTATANVTNIGGGSGSVNYLWTSLTTTYTSPTPSLSAGIWSISVTDALTGCDINQSFYISQPPPLNLVLSSSSPTTCAGTSVTLSGVNSGGTPYLLGSGYTYTWTGSVINNTRTVSQAVAGTPVYTLSSRDSLNCLVSQTISVDFIQNPVLSVSNVSICPLQTGTLTANGASSYTWNGTAIGNSFADNPNVTQQYSVVGSALGCTSIATASIILKPVPFALMSSNSPICNGQNLSLFANGGQSYFWNGPVGYSSSQQYPIIAGAIPNNSGVYNLTVTAANSCTASTSNTVVVNPTPTLSAFGSTVCVTQTLNLFSNSFVGASYFWVGPNSYTSNIQNPSVANPSVIASGIYTVKATSAVGCTNTATADVTVTAVPIPTITSNSPKCFGTDLNLNGSGGTSYSWTGPVGFSSAFQNTSIYGVIVSNGGVYTLQVTTGPCINTATHVVVINPLPSFSLSSNSHVCETEKLFLNATAVSNAVSYLWQPSSVMSFTGSQSQNIVRDSAKVHFSGVYSLSVIDANSCQNSATLAVNIYTNPILSPVSTTVCLNNEATLKVSGASTYTWTGPGFYYSNQAITLIKNATSVAPSIYTVIGGAANSCTSTTTASISTTPLPTPWLSVYPATKVCLNKEISLEGFGGSSYEWKGPSNFNHNQKVFTFTLSSPSYVGSYTLIATDALGCSNSTQTSISFDPLPDGTLLGTTMDACVPFSSDFSYFSSSTTTNIATQWQINNESVIQGKNFSRPFTVAGDYIIRGTFIDTISTCANTASFVVHAREIPVADFVTSPERPVEGIDEVYFTNKSSGLELSEWNWYFINDKGKISKQENTSYFFKNAGIYPVALLIKNKWGCADTIVKAIKIETDFNVYVPNAFTPNNDNTNPTFLPVCTGIKFYELNVFNRWGNKVFQTFELNKGWDGTFNGEPCKDDVYVWQIKVSSLGGEMKILDGHVTLFR
ncbi:T9SS type B sorting domain-containing protein [Aurantibacillus circumpalustris]|uniref:T9SS type B sorting domain-containing protein n=1 Tax=Aurantibacillus circumpalustris TaxID=3036359 RepID=UPI00295C19B0|nr:T9SS type B sorting domain-containing protein [Aurantibacillus circumpalustris]